MIYHYYYRIKNQSNRKEVNLQLVDEAIKYGVELCNPKRYVLVFPEHWILACDEPMTNRELIEICKSVIHTAQLGDM